MKIILISAILISAHGLAQTWAEKLGFPSGKRVLILHADDIGMCYEANRAAKDYLEQDQIQSAAAMVPCPWFDEFATWYREHPDEDVGLHLTLTSEWKHYRWGPVAPKAEVAGLVDPDGYLFRSVVQVATQASAAEVDKEIRSQIDRALSRGIKPGHIDTHMGTLYARPDYANVYMKVAVDYQIPAMVIELTAHSMQKFRAQGYPLNDEMIRISKQYPLPKLDGFESVPSGANYEEVQEKFFELVRSLKPGITEIIFHPAIPTECLQHITNSWRQRGDEAKLFADPKTQQFLNDEGVLFTNWKDMMRRHKKRTQP